MRYSIEVHMTVSLCKTLEGAREAAALLATKQFPGMPISIIDNETKKVVEVIMPPPLEVRPKRRKR